MTSGRDSPRTIGQACRRWLLAVASLCALWASGGHGLAAPPWADPGALPHWFAGANGVLAGFAVLRVAGIVMAGYLVAVATASILVQTRPRSKWLERFRRCRLPGARYFLLASTTLTMATAASSLLPGSG
ncbi:MAG: hypothetical protein ACR2NJ_13155, partial [Acidimicrobiales bacterium]